MHFSEEIIPFPLLPAFTVSTSCQLHHLAQGWIVVCDFQDNNSLGLYSSFNCLKILFQNDRKEIYTQSLHTFSIGKNAEDVLQRGLGTEKFQVPLIRFSVIVCASSCKQRLPKYIFSDHLWSLYQSFTETMNAGEPTVTEGGRETGGGVWSGRTEWGGGGSLLRRSCCKTCLLAFRPRSGNLRANATERNIVG